MALGATSLASRARAWILVGLALALGGSFPYLSRVMNANERPRILQALAIVDGGELAVDGPAARGIPAGVDVARSSEDGRLYPNKAPGATVAAVAGYAIVRTIAAARGRDPTLSEVTWAARTVGGLFPVVLLAWLLLRRLPGGGPAIVLVLLATPLVSYSHLLFGHALAAALLMLGLMGVMDALGARGPPWRAFVGGLLAGSAIFVEYGAALAGLPLAVIVGRGLLDPDTRPTATAAIAGALLPIAMLGLYHDVVFGSPWSTPYHHVVDPKFASTHARGLLGLTVPSGDSLYQHLLSPWGGLLYWAPLCVAVTVGAALRWTSLSPLARVATLTFATALLFNLGLSQTGGWRVGPRYLVVAMPLCIVPLSELLPLVPRRRAAAVGLVGIVLWSVLTNYLAANLFPYLIPVGNPLVDQLLPLWTAGLAPYGVLAPLLGPAGALAAIGVVTVVLTAWALLSLPWPDRRAVVVATLGGVAIAMTAWAAALSVEPAGDADVSLRLIVDVWEPNPEGSVVETMLPAL